MRVLTLCGLLLLAPHSLFAQDPPMKWGKIPQEHLEMVDFPADTNAAAVILADYGTVSFNGDYSLQFERHRRIKILSEAGFDWGTVSIPYYAKDRTERVWGVKAHTIVLSDDGKVARHELRSKEVFDEKVDDRNSRVRFTLPALQTGAVIEYRYVINVKGPYYMPDWRFQTSEPTLWSEFRPELPATLHFVRATRGMTKPLFIEESKPATRTWGKALIHRMVMKDVPALRDEPYMTTPNDYRAAVELQLSGYVEAGFGLTNVLHTWDKLATELRDIAMFRQGFDPPKSIRTQTQSLVAGLGAPEERLRAIYDFVRTSITWSGRMGVVPDQPLDSVLKTKKGSSPDIAVLLTAMLREAGFDANPVLVSTRTHGKVLEVYPIVSQFNGVIVHVRSGAKSYLLDATDPLRPYDLLPFEVLNTRGWMVGPTDAGWIDIESAGLFDENVYVDAVLEASGDVRARLQVSHGGYGALENRAALRKDGEKDFVTKVMLEGKDAVDVGTFVFQGTEAVEDTLKAHGEFVLPAYAQSAGDLMYVNPKLLGRIDKNPFRLPDRTFPVDFGYSASWSYTLKLALPDGYDVQDLPKIIRLRLKSGSAGYQRSVHQEGNFVVVQTTFDLTKAVYATSEYHDLRALYERVVALEGEQIVLKRRDAGTNAGAAAEGT